MRTARKWLATVALVVGTFSSAADASIWPTSHQRIAKALESGDVSERRTAASKLLELPPALARTLAKQALTDGDTEVQLHAARAAAALGVDRAGDDVVEWLQDKDVRLRLAACELIEAAPTPASVAALARVLGDSQAEVRKSAASAMGSSGMEDAVSPLLGHLDDGTASVRLEVVRALGRIGDKRAVVPLMSRLQDQSAEVRREAARALGHLGDTQATPTLMLTLQDKSAVVRVQALDALGKLRAADAVAAITALVSEQGDTAPGADLAQGPQEDAALRALGRIGTPEAVKLLIERLAGEGPVPLTENRRAPVREALALAGQAAVDGLVLALSGSPTQRHASAMALALARLGAEAAVPEVVRATQRGTISLDAGLRSVGELGDKGALPFVLEHIDDADARVRQIVVGVATQLLDPADKDGRAVDVVKRRVLDLRTPVGERMALVRLLGKTGSRRALSILLKLSKSKSVSLRRAVVEALGDLGETGKKVDAVLLEALADDSERLRLAAATALGEVGKDAAAAELLHRLGVSAEQDRAAIGLALSGALSHSTSAKLVGKVKAAFASAPATARDALLEGLGRMATKEAGALLVELSKRPDVDNRRKAAEALGGHPEAESALVGLLADADSSVRANAAWSLGKVGGAASLAPLAAAVKDLDVAVAGNAAVALARAATRAGKASATEKPLCDALSDYRSYVRAAALTGLRVVNTTCKSVAVRHILRRDGSWRARTAAAALLRARAAAGTADELDKRELARCTSEDRDAAVATSCSQSAPVTSLTHEVLVYVVPDGKTTATPRAPYSLVLADGSLRLGVADRRGALFESKAPDGPLELAVPAALAP